MHLSHRSKVHLKGKLNKELSILFRRLLCINPSHLTYPVFLFQLKILTSSYHNFDHALSFHSYCLDFSNLIPSSTASSLRVTHTASYFVVSEYLTEFIQNLTDYCVEEDETEKMLVLEPRGKLGAVVIDVELLNAVVALVVNGLMSTEPWKKNNW